MSPRDGKRFNYGFDKRVAFVLVILVVIAFIDLAVAMILTATILAGLGLREAVSPTLKVEGRDRGR